jgi:hypothetical protein
MSAAANLWSATPIRGGSLAAAASHRGRPAAPWQRRPAPQRRAKPRSLVRATTPTGELGVHRGASRLTSKEAVHVWTGGAIHVHPKRHRVGEMLRRLAPPCTQCRNNEIVNYMKPRSCRRSAPPRRASMSPKAPTGSSANLCLMRPSVVTPSAWTPALVLPTATRENVPTFANVPGTAVNSISTHGNQAPFILKERRILPSPVAMMTAIYDENLAECFGRTHVNDVTWLRPRALQVAAYRTS